MITRIKKLIADYHGEKEWFVHCLKTGGWQFYPGVRFKYDEWRIQLPNKLQIDVSDLKSGRYRVATGVPNRMLPWVAQWDDVEFAATGEQDTSWECKVLTLLNNAYRHPNLKEENEI